MHHSFNVEIATEYGLVEAILLEHLHFWITKNEANRTNFHDGRYWTFNSIRAFNELYPYLTTKKINNALKHLESENLIVTGNFNKAQYDRTKWYSITEKAFGLFGKSIMPKGKMESPKRENGFNQKGEPIPDTNTVKNTDIDYSEIKAMSIDDIKAYCVENGLDNLYEILT